MVIIFLALMGLLFLYEYPRIRRYGGGKKEVIAFAVFMLLALALGTAMVLRLPVPNPAKAIEAIFKPLGEKVIPKD